MVVPLELGLALDPVSERLEDEPAEQSAPDGRDDQILVGGLLEDRLDAELVDRRGDSRVQERVDAVEATLARARV